MLPTWGELRKGWFCARLRAERSCAPTLQHEIWLLYSIDKFVGHDSRLNCSVQAIFYKIWIKWLPFIFAQKTFFPPDGSYLLLELRLNICWFIVLMHSNGSSSSSSFKCDLYSRGSYLTVPKRKKMKCIFSSIYTHRTNETRWLAG